MSETLLVISLISLGILVIIDLIMIIKELWKEDK